MRFSFGNVFLKLCSWNYVFAFGICFSSKWFYLRLTFFLFSNLGLLIAQQTSIHINCFMAGEWHTSCHPILKMHIVGEGPGETPSALRCLSYLTNGFLTDIKQLAKASLRYSLPPFWCLSEAFSVPFSLIKLSYTKAPERSSLVPGPKVKSLNLTPFTVSYHLGASSGIFRTR